MEQYKIIKKLGNGKQGIVYLAKDVKTGKEVALKQIYCDSDTELLKAKEEVTLVQRLEHPNLTKYFGCFETTQFDNFTKLNQKYLWIVMEYCNGTLDGYMHNRKQPIPAKTMKKWWESILGAMTYMHQLKIFHRDIKPENILFVKKDSDNPSGEDWVLKLCDFGFSKHEDLSQGSMVGTLSFMAPEIGKMKYDSKADIFSIGVLFYQLLTLKPANRLENISLQVEKNAMYINEQLVGADPVMRKIIYQACQLDPKKRSTAEELLSLIRRSNETRTFLQSTEPRILCDRNGIILDVNHRAFHILHVSEESKIKGQNVNHILCPDHYSYARETYITRIEKTMDVMVVDFHGSCHPFRVVLEKDPDHYKISLCDIPFTLSDDPLGEELAKLLKVYNSFKTDFSSIYCSLRKELYTIVHENELKSATMDLQYGTIKNLKTDHQEVKQKIIHEKIRRMVVSKKYDEFLDYLKNDVPVQNALKFVRETQRFANKPDFSAQKSVIKKFLTKGASRRVSIVGCALPNPEKFNPEAFSASETVALDMIQTHFVKYIEKFNLEDLVDVYEPKISTFSSISHTRTTSLSLDSLQDSQDPDLSSETDSLN